MKNILSAVIVFSLLSLYSFGQSDNFKGQLDKSFIKNYKSVVLLPGNDHNRFIRKWDEDVKIYVSGDSLGKLTGDIEKCISVLNPYLNKIKMRLVKDKDEAAGFAFAVAGRCSVR